MRTQRAARPRLESMEVRRFPSSLGAALPAAQVLTDRAARLESHAAHRAAAHATQSHAVTREHHPVKQVKASHHAAPKPSQQNKNIFSNFFNSIFGGGVPKL
jgi:hypothetical protein